MKELLEYRRKEKTKVAAVQLDLDTDGFTYRKWGGIQRASAGDWLVDNGGDVYTVARDSFERTYRRTGPGVYEKVGRVWAAVADEDGVISTREGETRYRAGDVMVFNDPSGDDGYAMSRERFEELYEPLT